MSLPKLLPVLLFFIFLITVFMSNSGVEMQLTYYLLPHPIKVAFWELVTFCISLGIILAALVDFVSQLGMIKERKKLVKADREQKAEIAKLTESLKTLESENETLRRELDGKPETPVSSSEIIQA
jgi:hypothetical protein